MNGVALLSSADLCTEPDGKTGSAGIETAAEHGAAAAVSGAAQVSGGGAGRAVFADQRAATGLGSGLPLQQQPAPAQRPQHHLHVCRCFSPRSIWFVFPALWILCCLKVCDGKV